MVLHHLLHRLQDEIHLQRFAHGIRQHLFRAGIQDRGQVAEPSVQGDVSNVGQQHGSGAAGLNTRWTRSSAVVPIRMDLHNPR